MCGKKPEVSPTICPHSAGLLAGILEEKSRSLLFPVGCVGPWLQITDALLAEVCALSTG